MATLICEARRQHPSWGPDKLLDWLGPRHPTVDLPAVSTAGDLLARKGLVKKRRRRRHYQHPGVVPIKTAHPNDLWTADFKGHFRTRDGVYCYPLTVADQHTRYLLACHGLLSTKGLGVRPVFDRLFREYGLPDAIRTDNGVPFATTGIHGLSQLNVWWLRLGIQHQRTRPASPQENGAHERMHKTLKAEAIRPPRATLAPQQRAFNRFRAEYNDERPHQFLDGRHARVALSDVAPSLHRDAAAHRVSRTLHREAHHERRDVPVQEETALHRQLAEAAHHRPRGGRRRHLVDSFLSGPAGTARRTGLHHSWIVHSITWPRAPGALDGILTPAFGYSRDRRRTPAWRTSDHGDQTVGQTDRTTDQRVSPMFPVNFVTDVVPGCTRLVWHNPSCGRRRPHTR